MIDFVIGVDPDSDKHGIALYRDGKLIALNMWNLIEIVNWIQITKDGNSLLFCIEDVKANSFVYGRNVQISKAATAKIAMGVGRCQQAQVELIKWLEHLGVPYKLIKPSGNNWARGGKAKFEKATGWTGRSNEDTRSAAYFGFLGLNHKSTS